MTEVLIEMTFVDFIDEFLGVRFPKKVCALARKWNKMLKREAKRDW